MKNDNLFIIVVLILLGFIIVIYSSFFTGRVIEDFYLCKGDGLNNYQVKENVVLFSEGIENIYEDYCDGNYLYAYSCPVENDLLLEERIFCHNGCSEGGCLV
ncbi:hypothetical protein J4436_02010 [Candidatus Woesearchaeota archaeon]|nr:hypothetical protein [Candidatus Woesearchaeota archaeon]